MASSWSRARGLRLQLSAKPPQQRGPRSCSAHHRLHPGRSKEAATAPVPAPAPARTSVQLMLTEPSGAFTGSVGNDQRHPCPRDSPTSAVGEEETGRTLGLSAVQRTGMGEPSVSGQVCFQRAITGREGGKSRIPQRRNPGDVTSCPVAGALLPVTAPSGSPCLCCKYLLWLVLGKLPITRNNSRVDSPPVGLVSAPAH